MAELINLRTVRKRARRLQDEQRSQDNRLAHGRSKAQRKLAKAREEQASQMLDGHRIETGDGR